MELKPEDRALGQEIDREHAEELKQEERIVEALLFAMGRAVSLPEMAAALDADEVLAKAAAERLLQQYEARQGGMLIRRVETAYQLCTNPLCYEGLIRVVSHPKKPVLSDVVLETLAIIAYKQPVTKAEIERIRGVQSDHAVNRLVEYGLVEESGRLNAPGRPALFVTTEEFLRRFGMESLKELPALSEDMAAEIEAQVAEEVSDVLGTDPETLQEEIRSQRPELPEASAEEVDNVVPVKPVQAKVPVPRKQRETAAVRAAVEEERKEEERIPEADVEDDEDLEQMIYEAAMDTESTAEQHYSFLEEDEKVDGWDAETPPEGDEGADRDASLALDMEHETAWETVVEPDVESKSAADDGPVNNDAEVNQEGGTTENGQSSQGHRSASNSRHHSIFDSVQVLSDEELEEIEEEERRFRESLRTLPPRQRKPETQIPVKLSNTEAVSPTESPEITEAAAPELTESENTEAANAGSPEN